MPWHAVPVLRLGVDGTGFIVDAVIAALDSRGIDVARPPLPPVALTVAVAQAASADQHSADVVLTACDAGQATVAVLRLDRDRLAPWAQALASGRPDVTAPPRLLPHDPAWAEVAARRGAALRAAWGHLDPGGDLGLRRIDHIGSTAVPGLAAKPYLDLQVTCDRLPDSTALAAALAPLGWAPAVGARPDSPGVHHDLRSGHDTAPEEAFRKHLLVAPDPVRPAILHVRLTGSPFARRVVRFRDLLRTDPQIRHDYERMKREAAAVHADASDYDDYTRDKGRWLPGVHARLDDPAARGRDPWPLDGR